MSEEEIIEYLKNCLDDEFNFKNATRLKDKQAIQGLLDLYQKEKEKNKELRKPKYIMDFKTNKITKLTNDFVSKDKIKEKIKYIEENYSEHSGFPIGKSIEFLQELLEERN